MFYVFDWQVTNVRATGLLAQQGFTCGCHIAKLAEGGCLFGPRIGAAAVTGPARTAMNKSITTAWSHQQLRIALQVLHLYIVLMFVSIHQVFVPGEDVCRQWQTATADE